MSDLTQWLDAVCTEAKTAAKAGDMTLLNRLSTNPALAYYFNNVFSLQTLKPESWEQSMPQMAEAAKRLHTEYVDEAERRANIAKIGTLEAKLAKLEDILTQFVESQQPKKAAKKTEPKEAEEPKADAETEA